MLYVFLWVIPRRLNFICRRFETLYLFHLHRPMKMEHRIPKLRHRKFRLRGITQKKIYNTIEGGYNANDGNSINL
jgi:hypothetical protein